MHRYAVHIIAAALIGVPALVLRLSGVHLAETNAVLGIFLFGAAIIGAAFLLTWGAELAELEISANLALVFLALVAVLPEYAVDIYLAWTAGTWPQPGLTPAELAAGNKYQGLALANMTGANRLLIGLGWPLIAIISWRKFARPGVRLEASNSCDIFWLSVCTLYSFVIPLKGTITVFDAAVLLTIFGLYLWSVTKAPSSPPHLEGAAQWVAQAARPMRLTATWGFFVWAATVIFASSEPFAESLIHAGEVIGIDEFFLVQWLAPLASESPEFLAVVLLALKGSETDGLGALISSKVNQWSLLVGMVPLAFAAGHLNAFNVWEGGFQLDARQLEELVLTSTQSFYAVTTLLSYRFRIADALWLLALFVIQIVGTIILEEGGHHALVAPWHYGMAGLYMVIGMFHLYQNRSFLPGIMRRTFKPETIALDADSALSHDVEPAPVAPTPPAPTLSPEPLAPEPSPPPDPAPAPPAPPSDPAPPK